MDDQILQSNEMKAAIARGEKALKTLSQNHPSWIANEVQSLVEAYHLFYEDRQNTEKLASLSFYAHDLKGNAALFGYPIIGEISANLVDFILELRSINLQTARLIFYHIQGIQAILDECAPGNESKKAQALHSHLQLAVSVHQNQTKNTTHEPPIYADQ